MFRGFLALGVVFLLSSCISVSDEVRPSSPEDSGQEVVPDNDSQLAPETVESTPDQQFEEWPRFAELSFEGTGDDVIILEQPIDTIAIGTAEGTTELRQFAIWLLDRNGDYIDLPINTISPYTGTFLLKGFDEPVWAFEVTATGPWTLSIRDLNQAPKISVGESFSSVGDAVFTVSPTLGLTTMTLEGGDPDRQIAVWSYGSSTDLLVNTISPYSGTVRIESGTEVFAVTATGKWELVISGP